MIATIEANSLINFVNETSEGSLLTASLVSPLRKVNLSFRYGLVLMN